MAIKKLDDGRYKVDIRLGGREGRRIRKSFERKAEALAYERYVLANANKKEWAGKHADRRFISDLIDTWWLYHGQNLKNGEIEKRHLLKTVGFIGDMPITKLTKRMIMEHRSERLKSGISAATINRDMYRFSGMISALVKLEEFNGQNPLTGLPPLAEKNPGMTFLDLAEISRLLETLTGDDRLIALLSLSTGGRWGEVSTLTANQIVNARVTFLETKNGHKRTVPISPELEKEVKEQASSALFKVDYEKFCIKLREVKPDLPRGQATHVLRHTFASHFMMNGGNIIALQQILGHANITQTMAYAHLAPDYLQNAVLMNPLKGGLSV